MPVVMSATLTGTNLRTRLQRLLRHTPVRYVIAGGTATALNFLIRFPLSLVMPFGAAVACAQVAGFATGFTLYKYFVFTDARTGLTTQLGAFALVNAVSMVVVVSAALQLRFHLTTADAPLGLPVFYAEALAHIGGLACGSIFNFLGHRLLTFAPRKSRRAAETV